MNKLLYKSTKDGVYEGKWTVRKDLIFFEDQDQPTAVRLPEGSSVSFLLNQDEEYNELSKYLPEGTFASISFQCLTRLVLNKNTSKHVVQCARRLATGKLVVKDASCGEYKKSTQAQQRRYQRDRHYSPWPGFKLLNEEIWYRPSTVLIRGYDSVSVYYLLTKNVDSSIGYILPYNSFSTTVNYAIDALKPAIANGRKNVAHVGEWFVVPMNEKDVFFQKHKFIRFIGFMTLPRRSDDDLYYQLNGEGWIYETQVYLKYGRIANDLLPPLSFKEQPNAVYAIRRDNSTRFTVV